MNRVPPESNNPPPLERLQKLVAEGIPLTETQQALFDELLNVIAITLDTMSAPVEEQYSLTNAFADIRLDEELAQAGYTEPTPLHIGLLVTSPDGVIRQANRRTGSLLQRRPDLLVGQSADSLIDVVSAETFEQLIRDALDPDTTVEEYTLRFTLPDGATLDASVTAIGMRDAANNALVGIRWLMQPVSSAVKGEELFDTQERLRATFEQTTVGMAHIQLTGQLEQVNSQFQSMTGYTEEELTGLTLRDLLSEEDFQTDSRYMAELLQGHIETYTIEVRYQRKDGTWLWARHTGSIMHDPYGDPKRRILVVEDISTQKDSETQLLEALDRSEELYTISRMIGMAQSIDEVLEALIESRYLGDEPNRAAVLHFDRPWLDDGEVPECCEVIAEWRADESIPALLETEYQFEEYAFDVIFQRDEPMIVTQVSTDERLNDRARELFRSSGAESMVMFPLNAYAEWYGVLTIHYAEEHSFTEEQLRHMGGLVDQAAVAIASLRLLQSEAEARREAERANDLKMRFLAVVSHELRTPLSSIKGFTSTLLADDVTWSREEQLDFLETIDEEADKLGELIEQILDLSRLEAGTLSINKEMVTPSEILEIASVQLETMTTDHTLVLTVEEGLPEIPADPRRIAQVIANLASNAVRYSPEGSTITLEVVRQIDYIKVSVIDEGPGIPEDAQQEIFQPFSRATALVKEKGMGLGLAICRGIVDRHGGEIWVAETGPEGTTMAFTLPVTVPEGREE